jgi:hypothetical protein
MAKVLLLTTSIPSTTTIEANQSAITTMLAGKGVTRIESIDGAVEVNHAKRNELFGISEKRGAYPQVFIEDADGKVEFVGDFEGMESLNECSGLPAEILAANPGIVTFEVAMGEI